MTAAIRTTSNRTTGRTVRAARQHGPSPVRVGRAGRPAARPMCRAHVDPVDVTFAARRTARPSEATYRRRRAIVGTILAVFVAVGLVVAHDVLAGSGGVPASAAAGRPAHVSTVVSTVVARPGDTLWSIADEHRGDISISRYVDTLVDLNGGASIEAGQQIVLP
jgi:nucleoid-associated protein YgaU